MEHFVKYPRTSHLPWSMGRTTDDIVLTTLTMLKQAERVIWEKKHND